MEADGSTVSETVRGAPPKQYAGLEEKIPKYISPQILRELSRLTSPVSLSMIALEWFSIILAVWLSVQLHHVALYMLCVIWIGSRMLALGVLLHDAVHYRILRNKRWNDIISALFLAWPLFIDLENYRRVHYAHHRFVNTPRDPDWAYKDKADDWDFPMSWRKLTVVLLMSLFGLDIVRRLRQLQSYLAEPGDRGVVILRIVFYLSIAALLTYFKLWGVFLLYWVVPYLTWLNFAFRLRGIAEHSAMPDKEGYLATRTYFVPLFGRLFLAPYNVNYHIEHHIYPSVPFYRLPRLHALMMMNDEYRESAHLTRSILNLLRECVGLTDQKAVRAA